MENLGYQNLIKEVIEKQHKVHLGSHIYEDKSISDFIDFDNRLALRIYKTKKEYTKIEKEELERLLFTNAAQSELTVILVFPFHMKNFHHEIVGEIIKKSNYNRIIIIDIVALFQSIFEHNLDYKHYLDSTIFKENLKSLGVYDFVKGLIVDFEKPLKTPFIKNKKENQDKEKKGKTPEISNLEENITRLAGIQSDSDDGEDYLGIEEDVTAFARVMCAENFSPPLAIGLLGKWGAGKSFFMRKLQEKVEFLSGDEDQNIYCKGIAEVHFNAWSYMDANLWAGIITRIFERLNLYIKDEKISNAEKDKIKAEIAKKLSITSETIESLEKEKQDLADKIGTLAASREQLISKINTNINDIRKSTLSDILEQINISFNIEKEIDDAIQNNQSYIKTKEQLAILIPSEHWGDPINLYRELKSNRTLFRQFFLKETWRKNWGWLLFITLLVIFIPVGLSLLTQKVKNFDFTIPNGLWYGFSSISAVLVGLSRSYKKLSPLIASFWKIKNEYHQKKADYEQQKEAAIFEFEQKEKALKLKIDDCRANIHQIDLDIEQSKELEKSLENRINKTLSTETLYNFIEKKALSNDYKQYLGIVSIIRKDFEILSELFADSKDEKKGEKHKEIISFRKRFKKPLERVILYVDDLDRCSEERVVEVLEAVNLLMAFPLFIVVVGVDPRWVKNALKTKYSKQFTLTAKEEGLRISPSNYLEKIFQIPFHLKSAGDKDVKSMLRALAETTDDSFVPIDIEENPENTIITKTNPKDQTNINETPPVTKQKILESKVDLPIAPREVEKIELLKFSDTELKLIESMSVVLGNNPRAIKRFVNIYRVIKAHEIFKYSSETADEEVMAVLFMIALPLGNFKELIKSFKKFMEGYENVTLAAYFLEHNEYDIQIKKQLHLKLTEDYETLLNIDRDTFLHQYHFVKRFTFQ